jgi:hypothetical protein
MDVAARICRSIARRSRLPAATLLASLAITPARAVTDVICVGDCNHDRATTVDELLAGVNINLGRAGLATCTAFDLTGDARVGIDELVGALHHALAGCPPARYERVACVTPAIIESGNAGVREEIRRLAVAVGPPLVGDVCAFWGAGTPPARENEPVVSDVPTLILAGEYDPITRPDYGRLAVATLSRSVFIEFPSYSHSVTSPGCPADIAAAFLADPLRAPATDCVEQIAPISFLGT